MARNWGMQKSSVYSGSTNDRPHLCAVVDTLMFLWLELMIFILTPESVSWELLCSSLGMNFPVLFTFQDALTQNLNILVHFFFLKLCELRKVLQRKFLPFRQGFNYKAHDDGSCGFWGDVSCQCNPLHYSEHTKIIALILSLCKCDPCWPSSQTVCFQKYPEKHQK